MKVLAIAAALALPALFAGAPPALAAEGTGTIAGQVVDRTAGGGPVADVEVLLHAFARDTGAETGTPATARTDAGGRFVFASVDTAASRGYVATAEFKGVTYASDAVGFAAGETAKTVEIAVYQPTDKSAAIRLRQQHLIVTPDAASGTVQVVEIAIVQNAGDTTYVGTKRGDAAETLRLVLPSEAYDVDLGARLAKNAAVQPGAVVYTGPLLPGLTELILGYVLDRGSGTYVLRKLVTVDTDAVDVLIEDVGLTARSGQLAGPVSVEAGGKKYLRLTGRGLAAGSVYGIELSGTIAGAPSSGPLASLGSVAPLLGLLAIGLVSAYVLLAPRLREHGRARPRAEPGRKEVDEEEEEIVAEADDAAEDDEPAYELHEELIEEEAER